MLNASFRYITVFQANASKPIKIKLTAHAKIPL